MGLRQIAKGSALLLIGAVLSKILSFIYAPILARTLGPEGLGAFNLAFSLTSWFVVLGTLMLDTTIAKTISEYRAEKRDVAPLIRDLIYLTITFGLLSSLLFYFLAPWIAGQLYNDLSLLPLMVVASMFIFLSSMYASFSGILRGLKKFGYLSAYEFFKQAALVSVTLFLLLVMQFGQMGAALGMALSPLPLVVIALYRLKGYWFAKGSSRIRELLQNGKMITLIGVVDSIVPQLDKILLGVFLTKEAVGFYGIALTLATFSIFIVPILKKSILPFVSEKIPTQQFSEIKRFIETSLKYLYFIIGGGFILLALFRQDIVLLLFDSEFLPSADIVLGLLIMEIPLTLYTILNVVMIAFEKYTSMIKFHILSIALTLLTAFTLAPMIGIWGIVIAMIVGYSIPAVGSAWVMKNKINLNLNGVYKISAIVLIGILIPTFFSLSFTEKIIAAIILELGYLIFVISLRVFSADEMNRMKNFLIEKYSTIFSVSGE